MIFKHTDRVRNLSLRSKLVIGGTLILLVPMAFIGTVTFIKSSRTLEDISRLQLVQVADSLSGMIHIALEKDLRNLTTVATDPQVVHDTLVGEYANSQKKLSELYTLLSADFEGLAIYDTDGIIRADGVDEARVGISISERNYFKAAQEGKTGVGPVVLSKATGAPIFGLSAPIFSPDGEFLGGVLGVIKAGYLTTYISAVRIGKTGYVFMVDQEGAVIAHPDNETFLMKNIRDIADIKDLFEGISQQKKTFLEYTYRGTRKVTGICPVILTGWSVCATQSKNEIMSIANSNMAFLLVMSILFLLLVILAVFLLSKTISAPVQTTLTTLNHAIYQATEAFVIIGIDGRIQFLNPAMASIIDQPAEDIINKPFPPDAGHPVNHKEIRDTMEEGGIWSGHLKGTRQNGSSYTMDVTITPVFSSTEKLMCYLAIGRDITTELILHEQLQQSHKMEAIGTLAGGIAHDFNNILSVIFSYTELALQNLESRERIENYLNQILRSAERARDLVSHILTFSRKAQMDRQPIIPKYVIKETVKLLRASLPSTIEIRECLRSSAAVLGNPTQINQMVMNLSTNAGYEMRETGGVLDISLDEIVVEEDIHYQYPELHSGKYLQLKIADSGGGIGPGILDHIFEPFFTTKPFGEGTGLGLSVVHGIVKSMEGAISVDSVIGKGTVFTIHLPIIESRISLPGDEQRMELPSGTERVLLVDDEEAITFSIEALLEGLGYRVQAFTQSTLALEAFSAHPDDFDIIITDYTMPKMTGIALSKEIRNISPRTPIILCSGYLALSDKIAELQPIEFVKKPITIHELAHTLRHLLD